MRTLGGGRAGWALLLIGVLLVTVPAVVRPVQAAELPYGFQDTVVFDDLSRPTVIEFADDGRVFVAEMEGRILAFDGLDDEVPEVFADLRKEVYDRGDRGLLGMVLDPDFPESPYVYALYTYDHVLGDAAPAPAWGKGPLYGGDGCPPLDDGMPGFEADDCPVSGRLVRIEADGDLGLMPPKVLVEDWCQQFSSHSVGGLTFGPDGALYASGGDGASFDDPDWGQFGSPQKNFCGDPPGAKGTKLTLPTAEGGALRSQDLLTRDDPTGLDGTIIRIDPATGLGLPGNPYYGEPGADANEERVVAFGFRNPFRITADPESEVLYSGNVGWADWEEIDRFSPTAPTPYNSGWPCYEGWWHPEYASLDIDLCDVLADDEDLWAWPFFAYQHWEPVVADDGCPHLPGSAMSGLEIYDGDSFPELYSGALFFADSVRGCIYAMREGADGEPDPDLVVPFLTDAAPYPGIDIKVGPEGDLYYTRLFSAGFGPGAVHRIAYRSGNQPPIARLSANPAWGNEAVSGVRLTVKLDAGESEDHEGNFLKYEWDLDGDGDYDDSGTAKTKTVVFTKAGAVTLAVRVSDPQEASSVARVVVHPGNTPPVPNVKVVTAEGGWSVGDQIKFSATATDKEDGGAVPETSISWSARLHHCEEEGGCHAHPLQSFPAQAAASLRGPEHEYPSKIELTVRAYDSDGLSQPKTTILEPRRARLKIESKPTGLSVFAGVAARPTPFSFSVISGSSVLLAAPQEQELGGYAFAWDAWSNLGERIQSVVASSDATYTAHYTPPEMPGEPEEPKEPEEPRLPDPRAGPDPSKPVVEPAEPPQTRITAKPAKRTRATVATFRFRSSEPESTFRCALGSAKTRPCGSPRRFKNLRPGRYLFRVAAVTADGGFDRSPAVYRWRVLPASASKRP